MKANHYFVSFLRALTVEKVTETFDSGGERNLHIVENFLLTRTLPIPSYILLVGTHCEGSSWQRWFINFREKVVCGSRVTEQTNKLNSSNHLINFLLLI